MFFCCGCVFHDREQLVHAETDAHRITDIIRVEQNIQTHRHNNQHQDTALFRKPVPARFAVELAGLAVLGLAHSAGDKTGCKVHAHKDNQRHQRRIPAAEERCDTCADRADHQTDCFFHVDTSSTLIVRIIGCVLSVTAFHAR